MRKPVWKVVTKKRTSCIIKKGKYTLSYKKGKITRAKKDTLGVFCFKTKRQAEDFACCLKNSIVKVEPIGRGKSPKSISITTRILEKNFDKFYNNEKWARFRTAPYGTICYPAVKVLE